MRTNKYENLKVWQKANELALLVYKLSRKFPKEEIYGITSQLRRAVLSIPTNIVEGCSRSSLKEYIQFLYIALGSCAETEYLIKFSYELSYISESEKDDSFSKFKEISAMLNGLISSLKSRN